MSAPRRTEDGEASEGTRGYPYDAGVTVTSSLVRFQNGDRVEATRRYEQLGSGTDNDRGYSYAVVGRRAEAEAAPFTLPTLSILSFTPIHA